jgi:phosphoadenosine phosphosulfate reductase
VEQAAVNEVIVALSVGKDSLATLDVCAQRFRKIHAYFMYLVKGLRFQEVTLEWVERKYNIEVLRVPHFEIPRLMSSQSLNWYRPQAPSYNVIRMRELEDHCRMKLTNRLDTWIASGEKKVDGMQRRGMLNARGPWDKKRLHYYPIQDWTDSQVWSYLNLRRMPTPLDYSMKVHRSLDSFRGPYLVELKKHFPQDYQRILDIFPFVEAIRRRYEIYGTSQSKRRTEVSGSGSESEGFEERSL